MEGGDNLTGAPHVVAIPFPGRGHVNPMLCLCRLLAARGVPVTVVVTEEWLGLITTPPPPGVRFRTIPNVIPSEAGRGADHSGFLDAVYTKMEEPVERLLHGLDPPPTAVAADTFVPWAVSIAARRGIPACSLFTMSTAFFSVLCHFDRLPPAAAGEEEDEPLEKYIHGLKAIRSSDVHFIATNERPRNRSLEGLSRAKAAHCILFTSCYELEPSAFDALRAELACPVYGVGPSIPYMALQDSPRAAEPLRWLDSQPKGSVLYISLGSFLSVSRHQMDEIALGLRDSGVRFMWVARGDSERVQEMGGEMGLVVAWCEQLRVLTHESVGGFLTHCGWNSTLEGTFAGVPMLAFPLFWDQMADSRIVTDQWRVGLRLGTGGKGLVGRDEVAEVVKRFMDPDGAEGTEMRRRAVELRDACCAAVGDGGSSCIDIDSFVKDVVQVRHGC